MRKDTKTAYQSICENIPVHRLPVLLPKYLFSCIVLSKRGRWQMLELSLFDHIHPVLDSRPAKLSLI
ncbi:MAG: hypothetical protein COS27_04335 [Nitrospirae bacterium CG02_land_8_20_14_3_00_41_53]|nr:MAG: hypothetical protein COS27_04335 [Nitrospirae bacterium CG02_land_8_20_14_3_00_41_53]